MHRVDTDGHASNLFTDGNPGLGVEATVVDDDILNAFQEEIANAIEANGTALVKGTNTQLRSVLEQILSSVEPGGRLTLTTAVPVTTSDVLTATTVYYAPYKHNRIALYNGTRWVLHTFSELSQATTDATKSPAATAVDSNYDVFVWNDAGTLRATRGPAWTSDTGRGTGAGTTELERLNGRLVNKIAITNGPAAQRGLYVGSIRAGGSNDINDSALFRHVWNMYNRVRRELRAAEGTDTWNYTTDVFREANGAVNRIEVLRGIDEDAVEAEVLASAANDTGGASVTVGIGIDSSTVNSASVFVSDQATDPADRLQPAAKYRGAPGLGRRSLRWLEKAAAVGTTTWHGDGGGSSTQAGIVGSCLA